MHVSVLARNERYQAARVLESYLNNRSHLEKAVVPAPFSSGNAVGPYGHFGC